MGGQGSGGRNSKGKLRDVQCARLDVHELAREGKLKLGACGRLFGTIWFEVTGGPDARQLVLALPRKSSSGEPLEPFQQPWSAGNDRCVFRDFPPFASINCYSSIKNYNSVNRIWGHLTVTV